MWDIRRAGCIALLDQHASQRSAALPAMPMEDDWCGLPLAGAVWHPGVPINKILSPHWTCDADIVGGCASRPNTTEVSAEQEVVLPTATATAHDGRVTALLPMPNGLSWLSAATDSRVRLWSVPHFRSDFVVVHSFALLNFPLLATSQTVSSFPSRNTLVNFPNTHNRAVRVRTTVKI